MKKLIALTLTAIFVYANADPQPEQLNQRCAPCHGLYGQGIPGQNAPRLAGLPTWYLSKASKDYKKNARKNPLMLNVSGLNDMPDKEIELLSDWLSKQAINKDPRYDIKMARGDALAGEDKFNADCKSCHAKNGYGKKKKDAPPLASQYPGYLLASIKAFYHKERYHDNDPIDDTFDDISDVQARNIMAWMATLDDKKQQAGFKFTPASLPVSVDNRSGYKVNSVQQAIISVTADKNVSMQQAIKAMLTKASEIGVPQMPEITLKTTSKTGVTNLRFCAPKHVRGLIKEAPILAHYEPCKITIVKTEKAVRLITTNLDMLVDGKQLSPRAQRTALLINQDMLTIIQAGIKGMTIKTSAANRQTQKNLH